MKISLNKIRYAGEHYEVPNLVPDGVDALVEKIGAQLGAVEEVIPYGDRFDGVLIVKIVSCEKHPNADKLNICRVDDGGQAKNVERGKDGLVQVVCGAPNARAGILAAWLPPGATVPSTRGKEPFVLEARELRGEISNGMLASLKELGIGDNHDGILEVDIDVEPGTSFSTAYRTEGEAVIDIENKMFTHRPDCFGIMGVTREIAGIQGLPFKSPDWYVTDPEFPAIEAAELKLEVQNELPELVPRFTAVSMSDITVKPSPVWLQIVLTEAGIRPINNIVDYTNFWMLETGQPLHAYDYDKVKSLSEAGAKLVIRNPKPGEKIKLLNGKEIEPRAEAIMIATDKQLIGIGGVMGGSETEVDENTKSIILECANFDMYSIRRTSMAHGLFTDAVTRFNKGQSPLQNLAVLSRIVEHIREQDGGKLASKIIDDNHLDESIMDFGCVHEAFSVEAGFINSRLGLQLTAEEIIGLLTNVEFKAYMTGERGLIGVQAPFWRTDIEIPEDIVEEVGRLYGYDRLPLVLPERSIAPAIKNPALDLKAQIRSTLSRAGANEVLTYSFVPGSLLDKTKQDRTQSFEIANALSPDLQYYRTNLIPNLLEKVHPNVKAGYDEFALFEIGRTHQIDAVDEAGLPHELESVCLVYTSAKNSKPGAAFYEAKKFLMNVAASLNISLTFNPVNPDVMYNFTSPFDPNRSAVIFLESKILGIVGEFKTDVRQNLKLPVRTAGFTIDLPMLLNAEPQHHAYTTLSRFPKVTQDVTFKISDDITYYALNLHILQRLRYLQPTGTFTNLELIDIFQKPDSEYKHFTFRLTITSYERTLTDAEVSKLLEGVTESVIQKYAAERL